MKKKSLIALSLLFLITISISASELLTQQNPITITGTVSDGFQTIPGVSVMIKGTVTGMATDVDGNFSISIPDRNAVLVFSFIGYNTVEIPVGNRTTIDVIMVEDTKQLDEVVVVAYGTQKVRNLTGSVSKLNTDELSDMPVPNLAQKLQGKLAGVQIYQTSGEPNGGMSIRIRGQASINAGNSPLVVIDGFPSNASLSTLSPDEIENVTVLKDAASATLYGSRASNGVILVTTKQAKTGRTNIEFSTNYGWQKVPKRGRPDLMNAQEFAQFKKEYHEDQMRYEGVTAPVPEMYANPQSVRDGTDWFDVLMRTAATQNVNLSLSSGVGRMRSSVNLNYQKQEGVIHNTFFERFNVRANNVFEASDRVTFGLNLSGAYRNSQIISSLGEGRNIIGSAFLMDPQLKYKYGPDETPWDGTHPGMSTSLRDYYITNDAVYPLGWEPPGMFQNPNYYLVVTQRKNPSRSTTAVATAYMDFSIINGMKYRLSVNGNLNNNHSSSWTPSTATGAMFSRPPGSPTGGYSTSNSLYWMIENTLTYEKTLFEKHNINALAVYSTNYQTNESSSISSSNFPDDEVNWYGAASTRTGGSGSKGEYAIISYIGRLDYNYDGKYLLQLNFRSDGCSRFGANKRYANFPSISGGWIVSDESFMKEYNDLSHLKLRASWGKVGNNNIGNYAYLATVSGTNYVFNGAETAGRRLGGLDNNDLTWETTVSYDLGFELGFFKDRIFFIYDYYWKKTDGLLYQIDLPTQSGFSSVQSNIGEFNFWGHEFNLETRNFVRTFKWKTQFNVSLARNKVIKLGTENVHIGGNANQGDYNRTQVDHPMGQFYGYIYDGVYMTQAEFEAGPKHASSMVGTVRMKDLNNDGVINMDDRTFIGDPTPKFIYGLTNDFSYKQFDASIVIAGAVGGKIMDGQLEWTENIDAVFNVTRECADRWRSEENPGKGKIPRTRSGTTELFRYNNTRWVFDGTYLMVKNISLGYTVPLKTNPYVRNIRVFLSTQNPLTITKYPGMNPEVSASGSNGLQQGRDTSSYPVSQIYTLGLNVRF